MASTKRTEPFDKPGKLMTKTINLMIASKKTPIELQEETGLPYYWLRLFVRGHYANPSVNRVETLYKHLSGKDVI